MSKIFINVCALSLIAVVFCCPGLQSISCGDVDDICYKKLNKACNLYGIGAVDLATCTNSHDEAFAFICEGTCIQTFGRKDSNNIKIFQEK